MPKKTILVLDDEKSIRTLFEEEFKDEGYDVVSTDSGEEALEMLDKGTPHIDLITLDIKMPKMDGYTLAGEIRKYAKFKNLPLIAVTSRTSKTDRMRGVESGMTEYITKPYSPEYLMNVVKRNINLTMEVTE